jgi:hypothetical protein
MEMMRSGKALNVFVRYGVIALLAAMSACEEDDSLVDDETLLGAVRPVGKALSAIERFEIGSEGGSITTGGGVIEIIIPPGSLSDKTTIGIQEVENTSPNGIGSSYLLTPHDIEFQKPVSIALNYNEDSVSFGDGLGIAYQDEKGIWYASGNANHETTEKKVTVQTTHFSPWSLFESVHLNPAKTTVDPGGRVTITATAVVRGERLLTSLIEPQAPLVPMPLDPTYIKEWRIEDEGLLYMSGNTVTYEAPNKIPAKNPVHVILVLKTEIGKPMQAVSKITVGGSEVTFGGGPYSVPFTVIGKASAMFMTDEDFTLIQYTSEVVGGTVSVSIAFPGKAPGTHPWSKDKDVNCFVISQHKMGGKTIGGTYGSVDENEIHIGSVTVDRYEGVGGVVSGSFQGNYTFIDEACGACFSEGTISGKFTARRVR